MESKKITQLATEVAPLLDDLTFIGDPITGQLKKVTLNQIAYIFGAGSAWGTITGTLSNQTDLQAALNLKANDNEVVKLTGNQTINGIKTFNNIVLSGFPVVATALVYSKGGSINPLLLGSTKNMTYAETGSNNIVVEDELSKAKLIFDNSVQAYTFPAATGTIALTSNLTSYVPYTGATSDVNLGTYDIKLDNTYLEGDGSRSGSLIFKHYSSGGTSLTNHTSIYGFGEQDLYFNFGTSAGNKTFTFDVSGLSLTTARTYTMPNASGTLALTSNLSAYIPYTGATTNVDLGANTLTANIVEAKSLRAIVNGTASSPLILKTGTSGLSFASDAISLISSPTSANTLSIYFDVATVKRQANFTANSLTATRTYTLPDASGTLALTSDLTSFITLTSLSASSPLSYNNTTGAFSIQVATTSQNGYLSSIDWNTFNGKQNALTNPVTGTGTTNYLPKFTGASTIGNSIIQDNSSYIYVNGAASINGGVEVLNGWGININNIGNSSFWKQNNNSGTYELKYNSSAVALSVYSDNNVGIGTTANAGYKLDVNGTGRFSGASIFSSNVTIGGSGTTTSKLTILATTGVAAPGSPSLGIYDASNPSYGFDFDLEGVATGDLYLSRLVAGTRTAVLQLSRSTGAATFSSSVTAGGLIKGQYFNVTSGTLAGYLIKSGDWQSDASTDLSLAAESANIRFYTNGSATEKMRISSTGNVGIGTSSPQDYLSTQLVVSAPSFGGITIASTNSTNTNYLCFARGTTTNLPYIGSISYNHTSDFMAFATGATERMRITSSGDVVIGDTSAFNAGKLCISADATRVTIASKVSATTGAEHIRFINPNGIVGYISTSGSVTTYSITSDYRLKQDFKDYNALDLISKIKTYDYEWKSDKSRMFGVVAHELQEVVSYAVTGEKDAIDEEGNAKMQGVDYSKLVPIMVKAIQEMSAQIEELKQLINK